MIEKGGLNMDINEVQDTLQKLKKCKIPQSEIAKALKKDRSNINAKAKRGTELKLSEVQEIEKYFNVVLTDSACQMLKFVDKIEQHNNNIIDFAELEYFPDVYLSAGYGCEVLDEYSETVVIDSRFLMSERGMPVNPKNCKMVCVSGNSMFPEYHHGDRVIIDESDLNLTDGQIYAFRYDGQCYVKEINRAGNKIKCISVNKEYEPFFIERDVDFKVFGRILPRIRL